ncbi:hemolytic enterotoxin [Fictibacillus macauensis ZFHKF-1]|uniref:Hemolytic enterotoxin n=1 Tax=Fictibacillus macauensis ZFHKF-1 TaxID=1196324 RepID=I8UCU6_9BACL|nr:HBL/NHE enterotoxin family protein [Fictibacillus macauensis]EIT84745.1 hemolytic enterotoxin [Fictibacillus macauensis ZFHKF-1]
MKKTLITGVLATTLAAGATVPMNALAATPQKATAVTNVGDVTIKNTLSSSIFKLGSQTPLLTAYGLVVLKQPDVKGTALTSFVSAQRVTKNNVKEWLDEQSPKLVSLNQDMMRFSSRYAAYQPKLAELAGKFDTDPAAKESFLNAFNKLKVQASGVKDDMEQTLVELERYKQLLDKDNQNLTAKGDKAIESLNANSGELANVRAEIKKIEDEIQEQLTIVLSRPKEIIKGSIKVSEEVFTTVNETGTSQKFDFASVGKIADALIDVSDDKATAAYAVIQKKTAALMPLYKKLALLNGQATQITIVEDQASAFADMVDRQIAIYKFLVEDWTKFSANMDDLSAALTQDGVKPSAVKLKLEELDKFSTSLGKQTKQFDDFTTQVEVLS